MPRFSIIIPVYNVASYLRECLDSVLNQTYSDWECICVDDGSTDGSSAILDVYVAKDKRFRVVHQKNQGVSVARNAALDLAKGEWICFVDADDVVEPLWIEHIADAIFRYPNADVVRTGWTRWVNEGALVRRNQIDADFRYVNAERLSAELYWELISGCSYPFTNIIRRAKFDNVRFIVGVRFREDALYEYTIASYGGALLVVHECGYLHRERSNSALHFRERYDTIKLMREYLSIWKANRFKTNSCVKASSCWILKDVREWVALCHNNTYIDDISVCICAWRLLFARALSLRWCSNMKVRLRWVAFLLTGWSKVFKLSIKSIKGSI